MTSAGRPRPRLVRRLALVATAVALALAACGIPVSAPEALPTEGREDLLQGTTTTTTIVDPAETVQFELYFLNPDDELETIERTYVAGASINEVLKDLVEQPPQPDEQPVDDEETGLLRTAIPDGLTATLLDETPAQAAVGVRVIQVNPEALLRESLDEAPDQARLGVKQLVCTFLGVAPDGTIGVELHDDQGELPLTDDAAQPFSGGATEERFGGCITGTQERLELVEGGDDSTSETSAEDAESGQSDG